MSDTDWAACNHPLRNVNGTCTTCGLELDAKAERNTLRAENARLREALVEAGIHARLGRSDADARGELASSCRFERIEDEARAALQQAEEKT